MIDRRTVIASALAAIASSGVTRTRSRRKPAMSRITAYAFSFPALDGGDIRLADYAGHPLLIVNTASLCGYTPQYAGLQQLWTQFHDRGLMIVGVPSNDFGGQEPGGASRDRGDRAAPIWRYLPDRGQDRGERPECASVLQMGGRSAAEGCAALELPQISDRPRRLHRRRLPRAVEPTDTRVKTAIARALADYLTTHISPELTGSAQIGPSSIKAVAVAAPVQLGYDAQGREMARTTAEKPSTGHGSA